MIAIVNVADYYFSSRWIEYCQNKNIPYKEVDVYKSDIMQQVNGCEAFMWHWDHESPTDHLFARQLIASLESKGIKVFPDLKTCWHFDDKVGQSYLFEALGISTPKNWVFFDEQEALVWAENVTYPQVSKLRGGAGASNVKLVRSKSQAIKIIKKSFKRGNSPLGKFAILKDNYSKWIKAETALRSLLGAFKMVMKTTKFEKYFPRQIGYVYFQEFIANNDHDIRVIVIGSQKAFALKRNVRKGDFRASGSGCIIYDKNAIPIECVKEAFRVAELIKGQSIAFDFVFDKDNRPLIVEISYGFAQKAYDKCSGYWDKTLQFHEEIIHPQWWMMDLLLGNNSENDVFRK